MRAFLAPALLSLGLLRWLIDDVRRALQPLIDKGIVLDVQEALSGARYDTGGLQSEKGTFTVIVAGSDPEARRPGITALLHQAGLMDKITVSFQTKPASPRV